MPGDRLSSCKGLMKPVGLEFKSGKGYQIVYVCMKCGAKRVNKMVENTIQSDDIERIIKL